MYILIDLHILSKMMYLKGDQIGSKPAFMEKTMSKTLYNLITKNRHSLWIYRKGKCFGFLSEVHSRVDPFA